MIFFNCTNDINENSELYKYMSNTLQNLYKQLDLQKHKKDDLILWTDKIADICIDDNKYIDTTALLSIVDNLKNNLENIRFNIQTINSLISSLNTIISSIDNSNDTHQNIDLSKYYMSYIEKQNTIFENDLKIETLFNKIYQYSNFSIPTVNEVQTLKPLENIDTPSTIENSKSCESFEEHTNTENKTTDNNTSQKQELFDNDTLIISETKNKVFLPYKLSDLEEIVKANPNQYDSVENLINTNYIIPLDKYKNSSFARFKEAYLLMRNKEKSSFFAALELSLELTFKYNLNPAIITACKNLDELDIYLDCLDEMALDDFKIFDIKYEIAPMKIQHQKM